MSCAPLVRPGSAGLRSTAYSVRGYLAEGRRPRDRRNRASRRGACALRPFRRALVRAAPPPRPRPARSRSLLASPVDAACGVSPVFRPASERGGVSAGPVGVMEEDGPTDVAGVGARSRGASAGSVSCIISCPIASGGPVSDCGGAMASRVSMETGSRPPAETRCNTAEATASGSARVDDLGGCEPVRPPTESGCFTSSKPAAERSATVPDAGTASVRRKQGTARRRSLAECRERREAMKNRRSTRKRLPRCRAPKKRSMSRRLEACCTGAALDQRSQPLISRVTEACAPAGSLIGGSGPGDLRERSCCQASEPSSSSGAFRGFPCSAFCSGITSGPRVDGASARELPVTATSAVMPVCASLCPDRACSAATELPCADPP